MLAVAHDGDPVAEGKDFIEPVADVDDADALSPQVADDLEEFLDLARGKRSRRFIHDEDAGFLQEGLGDLDRLLLGDRQIPAEGVEVEWKTQPLKQGAR